MTSLFFLWAIGVNLNDILIPHMKKAFGLSDFRSSLIQSAFFGGYFIAALPAGWLIQRTGYKKGILFGLLVCATGAFLFIPAASERVYAFFLLALFIMACGQSCLEVAANPYVTLLGPAGSSERRLNLAQSFNAVGAVITPILGTAFILSGIEHRKSDLEVMSSEQLMAYRMSEANMVKIPYLVITGIFLAVAVLIHFSNLPEVRPSKDAERRNAPTSLKEIWSWTHFVQGVLAQFFYVGAQVGVASFVIRFAQFSIPGIREKAAAQFLQMHMLGFMIGRFTGSAIMRHIPAPNLLRLFSSSSMLCLIVAVSTTGRVPVWAVVLIGFFHSIMFPTIFALSLKNLGPYTKLGSSLLVMSIIGGAIFPAIMGLISDATTIQYAFAVPFLCHGFVLYFALRGYRPVIKAQTVGVPVPSGELQ